MRKILIGTVYIFLIGVFSWNLAVGQNPETLKIPNPKKLSGKFDEFITDKTYLPLETRSDCLLPGHSPRVHIYRDLIYISYEPREGLYIFTKEGKFVNSFKSYGRGPNEIVSIYGLSFYQDELFLLDWKGGKIMVLDLTGHPKRTISTPSYPYDIIHNDKGQLLLYIRKEDFKGKPYDIIGFDEKTSEFYGFLASSDYYKGRAMLIDVFANTPIGATWACEACDTVFSIRDEKAIPAYILDFGKLSLSEDQKRTFDPYALQQSKKPIMALEGHFQQAGNIISFLYSSDKGHFVIFCDLLSKKYYGGAWEYPELELGRIYLPMGNTIDSFLFVVDAIKIIEEVEEHLERCSDELIKVAKGLSPEDNPVLISWKVK